MGRKRVKIDVEQALLNKGTERRFDPKDSEGFYPFSSVWQWVPQNGVQKGQVVSLTIDGNLASDKELLSEGNNEHRFFYSEYGDQYPWLVNALGISLKTYCLETRISQSEASYTRNAIGAFLGHCRSSDIKLDSSKDLNFKVLCEWRNSLRYVKMKSRYKSVLFRRVCKIIEKMMGSRLLPEVFTVPIYSSDPSEHLPAYSDAVMYQLISACIADIENIRLESLYLDAFRKGLPNIKDRLKAHDWRWILLEFFDSCSFRGDAVGDVLYDSNGRRKLNYVAYRSFKFNEMARDDFLAFVPPVLYGLETETAEPYKRLAEKEIPTRDSLFPFFLFFLICSGKNKETVLSWKSKQKVGADYLSPLKCKDPLSNDKVWVRGYKGRGKGRGISVAEDTYIQISDDGVYPVLEFLLWYIQPLATVADSELSRNMWLYFGNNGTRSFNESDMFFHSCSKSFLTRHAVWDLSGTDEVDFGKERLYTLDSRRFRKVFAAKEFIKAISEVKNHQELAESLKSALSHSSFDTTLGSYLALGMPKVALELGIHTLQNEYLAQAREFRGVRREHVPVDGVSGLLTACADPQKPDFEGAVASDAVNCAEYDLCLGCSQSRVFDVHLPRIAKRILQYEEFRSEMSPEKWDAEYGRKFARAHDVLAGWKDRQMVETAWEAAKNGKVRLPKIIFRGGA